MKSGFIESGSDYFNRTSEASKGMNGNDRPFGLVDFNRTSEASKDDRELLGPGVRRISIAPQRHRKWVILMRRVLDVHDFNRTSEAWQGE